MKPVTVKKIIHLTILLLFLQSVYAQKDFEPKITVKWAPTGLILGDASFQGEYSFLKKSSLVVSRILLA